MPQTVHEKPLCALTTFLLFSCVCHRKDFLEGSLHTKEVRVGNDPKDHLEQCFSDRAVHGGQARAISDAVSLP